jgi:hypothetical protein
MFQHLSLFHQVKNWFPKFAGNKSNLCRYAVAVTGRLLEINPEVFTAWNFRREAIVCLAERAEVSAAAAAAVEGLSLAEEDRGESDAAPPLGVSGDAAAAATAEEDKEATAKGATATTAAAAAAPPFVPPLQDELALTERTLRKNPKSYTSWWGLYKLNSVDPKLESTRFQPLSPSSEFLVSKCAFQTQRVTLPRGTTGSGPCDVWWTKPAPPPPPPPTKARIF